MQKSTCGSKIVLANRTEKADTLLMTDATNRGASNMRNDRIKAIQIRNRAPAPSPTMRNDSIRNIQIRNLTLAIDALRLAYNANPTPLGVIRIDNAVRELSNLQRQAHWSAIAVAFGARA
jgi:hypothetical protein